MASLDAGAFAMKPIFIDSQPFRGLVGGSVHVRENRSERGVTVPPARLITDETGAMWTLGTEYAKTADGWGFDFNVLRNDIDTGEMASRIEFKGGKVRIFSSSLGWRVWTGKTFI